MNPRWNDPVREFNADVMFLAAAGIDYPAEFNALRDRYRDFTALKTPCRDRLRDYMLDPNSAPEDLALLRAAAMVEQDSQAAAQKLNTSVQHWIHTRLKEINNAVAADNYATVAQRFDAEAKKFAATTKLVDVDATAEQLIAESDRVRKAWLEAALIAGHLNEYALVLAAAARLAGTRIQTDGETLALVCEPGDTPAQEVWQAWYHTGRCGRWSALASAGIAIRAAQLDWHTAYPSIEEAKPDKPRRGGMMAV